MGLGGPVSSYLLRGRCWRDCVGFVVLPLASVSVRQWSAGFNPWGSPGVSVGGF